MSVVGAVRGSGGGGGAAGLAVVSTGGGTVTLGRVTVEDAGPEGGEAAAGRGPARAAPQCTQNRVPG